MNKVVCADEKVRLQFLQLISALSDGGDEVMEELSAILANNADFPAG